MSSPSRPVPRAAAAALLLAAALPLAAHAQCSPTSTPTWCAHQDSEGVGGGAEGADRFGAALAWGDFDGDGCDDLAVGAPGENNGAGVVHVFYSNGFLLTLAGQQLFGQEQLGGADEGPENGDGFGTALAAGDFDGDGFADLVIGSPGEDLPDPADDCTLSVCQDTGGVHLVSGGPSGLDLGSSQFFNGADLIATSDSLGEHDRLGTALAVGDFNFLPDGVDDLAIGAPSRPDTLLGSEVGKLFIAFGHPNGLNNGLGGFALTTHQSNCQSDGSLAAAALVVGQLEGDVGDELVLGAPHCQVAGADETGNLGYLAQVVGAPTPVPLLQTDYASAGQAAFDHFGSALAAGDFDGNGFDDLAAGAPDHDHGAGDPESSGRVYVAYSAGGGPDPAVADIIGEDEWVGDTPGAGERFGSALAAGDVDGDGFADLLAGAPGEGSLDVGRVYLKRGSPTGLTTVGNDLFTQTFLGGSNGTDDHLGSVIALGDVDGDGVLEIALGVADKDVGVAADAGMVYVTRAFGPLLFKDGFEAGSAGAWSAVSP